MLGLFGLTSGAGAASVSYDGLVTQFGTGNGPVLGILSLQASGQYTTEWGFTGWSGSGLTADTNTTQVHTGSGNAAYVARNVDQIMANGIGSNTLGLVFQVNQVGNVNSQYLQVSDFIVKVYSGTTGAVLGTATYTGGSGNAGDSGVTQPLFFSGVGQGSTGYLFDVNLSTAEQALWFGNGNYIGITVLTGDPNGDAGHFLNANDGSDNFWVAKGTGSGSGTPPPPPSGTPLPASAWGGMALIAGLGALRFARRRSA
jgi:hypothetical protein